MTCFLGKNTARKRNGRTIDCAGYMEVDHSCLGNSFLTIQLLKHNFVETPRKFIIAKLSIRKLGFSLLLLFALIKGFAMINLRDVSTKLYSYLIFTMQTYKELIQLLQYIAVQDKCVHALLARYVHPVVCNKLFNAIHLYTHFLPKAS